MKTISIVQTHVAVKASAEYLGLDMASRPKYWSMGIQSGAQWYYQTLLVWLVNLTIYEHWLGYLMSNVISVGQKNPTKNW